MKILLIGNQPIEVDVSEYYDEYADFFEQAASHDQPGVEVEWTIFDNLYIQVGDGKFVIADLKNGRDLDEYDLLYIRGRELKSFYDVMYAISRYAVINNVPIINNYSSHRNASKLSQAVLFYEMNLPVPLTVYVGQAVLAQAPTLPFAFPCIMKATFGSHGNDNYLVRSYEEVREIVKNSESQYVLQRFIPNDGDFRILIIGKEVLAIRRKAVVGSHLNNTSQGGSAEMVALESLPKGLVAHALTITRYLDMNIAGVDVIMNSGDSSEYLFLEINSQPQLMTGAFIEDKKQMIGEYLRQLSK